MRHILAHLEIGKMAMDMIVELNFVNFPTDFYLEVRNFPYSTIDRIDRL